MNMKKNVTVDLVKGVACIFVILIHCRFPGALGDYIAAIARFAVPFFALVTGYYSYDADRGRCIAKTKAGLKKTGILIASGIMISAIFNSIASIVQGSGMLDWLFPNLTLKNAAKFILFNRLLFVSWSIWYLFALLYVYLVYILLLKLNLVRFSYRLAPLLLFCNIIIQEVLDFPWYVAGNFLFTVLPFFLIGRWVNEKGAFPSRKLMYCILITSTSMVLFEQFMLGESALYIGTIGVALTVFILAKDDELAENTCAGYVGWLGRYYSMPVYLCHCGIIQVLNALIERGYVVISPYMVPLVVIVASMVIATPYVLTRQKHCHRKVSA